MMSRDMTDSEAISNLNHIYGIVSPDIQRSLDVAFEAMKRPQGEWIPVSERLPEQNGFYITTCRDICENRVHTVGFDGVRKKWGRGGVIAWQPLPEPYKKEGSDIHKSNCVTCDHFGKCEGCEKREEE